MRLVFSSKVERWLGDHKMSYPNVPRVYEYLYLNDVGMDLGECRRITYNDQPSYSLFDISDSIPMTMKKMYVEIRYRMIRKDGYIDLNTIVGKNVLRGGLVAVELCEVWGYGSRTLASLTREFITDELRFFIDSTEYPAMLLRSNLELRFLYKGEVNHILDLDVRFIERIYVTDVLKQFESTDYYGIRKVYDVGFEKLDEKIIPVSNLTERLSCLKSAPL